MKSFTSIETVGLPRGSAIANMLTIFRIKWRVSLMHILAILATIVAGAAVWFWRLKMLGELGSEAIDSVSRMRGYMRRRSFRKKVEDSTLSSITSPAIAAAVLCCRLANEKPQHKEKAIASLRRNLSGIIDEKELDEVIVFADWAARDLIDPKEPVRRFQSLWQKMLTPDECRDLVSMARETAEAGGQPTPEQTIVLEALSRNLTPQT